MTDLEKYIKNNYNPKKESDLRKELVSQGYSPEDFESYIELAKKGKISKKKYYVILTLILLSALIVRFFLINSMFDNPDVNSKEHVFNGEEYNFPSNPAKWMSDGKLDVVAATNGSGFIDSASGNAQYYKGDIMTAFVFDGYFKGEYFQRNYSINGTTYLEITDNLNASDGIPQIMIVYDLIQGTETSKVLIFVDEDWKKKIVPNYIRWGPFFENSKIFSYDYSPEDGIYMDMIENMTGFESNFNLHRGGVAVGDITQKKIDQRATDVTYVRAR